MKTKVKIVPAHEASGFIVEWFFQDSWNEYGFLIPTEQEAKNRAEAFAKFEGWDLSRVRVVPKKQWVAEFPSLDYIEKIWLMGYQGARSGEENPYAENDVNDDLDNFTLWNEGAEAFRSGLQLFGN